MWIEIHNMVVFQQLNGYNSAFKLAVNAEKQQKSYFMYLQWSDIDGIEPVGSGEDDLLSAKDTLKWAKITNGSLIIQWY